MRFPRYSSWLTLSVSKFVEARGLSTLIFDRLYDSSILSSLLLTLGNMYISKMQQCISHMQISHMQIIMHANITHATTRMQVSRMQ